jgi:hypothetical protein
VPSERLARYKSPLLTNTTSPRVELAAAPLDDVELAAADGGAVPPRNADTDSAQTTTMRRDLLPMTTDLHSSREPANQRRHRRESIQVTAGTKALAGA